MKETGKTFKTGIALLLSLTLCVPGMAYTGAVQTAEAGTTSLQTGTELVADESPNALVVCGDADRNGSIDASDALAVLRAVVKLAELSDAQTTAADVDGNGKVEASDALLILKHVVKLIDTFPVGNGGTGTESTVSAQLVTKLYADFLRDVHDNPGNYVADVNYANIESDSFAITDINQDGVDDLLISFGHIYTFGQHTGVWTIDTSTNTVVECGKLYGYDANCEVYSNGVVKVNETKNIFPGQTIWPYDLYRYDESRGEYVRFAFAGCIDKGYKYYDASNDADGDGVIYMWTENKEKRYLTLDEYNEVVNKYIPADAKIDLDMKKLTEENIDGLN